MIQSNIVRRKVLAIINEKISEKQKDYSEKSKIIDNECAMDIKVKKANIKDFVKTRKAKGNIDKLNLLDGIVQDIIGKVID